MAGLELHPESEKVLAVWQNPSPSMNINKERENYDKAAKLSSGYNLSFDRERREILAPNDEGMMQTFDALPCYIPFQPIIL